MAADHLPSGSLLLMTADTHNETPWRDRLVLIPDDAGKYSWTTSEYVTHFVRSMPAKLQIVVLRDTYPLKVSGQQEAIYWVRGPNNGSRLTLGPTGWLAHRTRRHFLQEYKIPERESLRLAKPALVRKVQREKKKRRGRTRPARQNVIDRIYPTSTQSRYETMSNTIVQLRRPFCCGRMNPAL